MLKTQINTRFPAERKSAIFHYCALHSVKYQHLIDAFLSWIMENSNNPLARKFLKDARIIKTKTYGRKGENVLSDNSHA